MTILQMCEAAKVSRAVSYLRHEPTTQDRDIDLRDEIQKIALEFPSYGRRRITAELRRRGWKVNHKRVHRITREDNLLCLRRRKFVVTTNSNHPHPVYPNLAADLDITAVRPDAGSRAGDDRVAPGLARAAASTRPGASFRPGPAVRLRRLHRSAEGTQHHDQHEPQRKPTTRSGSIRRSAIGRRRSSNGFKLMLRKHKKYPDAPTPSVSITYTATSVKKSIRFTRHAHRHPQPRDYRRYTGRSHDFPRR